MNFVAFDVETANADLSSICQIGVVIFKDGAVSEVWESHVNPESYFDGINIGIHGITSETVRDSPRLPAISDRLRGLLSGQVVVHHTGFDRVSLSRALSKYGIEQIECRWLDTARVVRRTWLDLTKKGYGLSSVAKTLGIDFRHHEAGEDARVSGEILLKALGQLGVSLDEVIARSVKGGLWHRPPDRTRSGDPDGPLVGEVLVFTGALSMSRSEAADMAARAGCDVGANVTKATTILVVGGSDILERAVQEKSNKQRKAEDLIAKGQSLRILSEDDFARLVELV